MRRGFSSTEIVVCTAILGLAMVPILTMIGGGTRPTAYNEYHMLAQSVSAHLMDRVIEQVATKGFGELERMGVGDKIDLSQTFTYKLPADASGLNVTNDSYFQQPQIFLTNLADAGGALYQVTIVTSWTVPGDTHRFTFNFERLVCRPEASLIADYVPRQQKTVIP